MKRAIATVCMSGSLADKLAAAAEAGFAGVEIFENDLTYFDGRPEDVRDPGDSPRQGTVSRHPGPAPARGRARPRGLARPGDRSPPAVPRLRGPARAHADPRLRARAAQV